MIVHSIERSHEPRTRCRLGRAKPTFSDAAPFFQIAGHFVGKASLTFESTRSRQNKFASRFVS